MRTVDAAGLSIGPDHPPRIMGVLNVSEESPYDPSVFADPGEAAAFVDEELIDEGADVVDVGLESANKRLDVLGPEEELDRLDVAIETIESVSGDAVFSIETRYHEVADEALSRGFDVVNDVCGFADPEMPDVCADHDAAVVKMASPPDLDRPGAVDDVDWASRRSAAWAERATYVDQVYAALEDGGFTEKTIVDPAFGGWSEDKTLEDDRETFRRLGEFRALDRPILVSINRKNFLRKYVDRSTDAALPVSLGATAMAVERGADVIRTHDVAATRDAARIGRAFERDRMRIEGPVAVRELGAGTRREVDRHLDRIGASVEYAGDGASHAIEIDGLDPVAIERLATVAGDVGVTVADGTDAVLVLGCETGLDRFVDGLPDDSDAFRTIATAVSRVIE
ncbi:MAG TPA: dihydropteroate synthase [Natrialbaceae archaeon]|nr:dihydropteroate synthase [Natrialbaceae archaeon]